MSEEINITVAVLEQWLKAHEASPEPIGGVEWQLRVQMISYTI